MHFLVGERLFTAGEEATHLYFIQSGTVELRAPGSDLVFATVGAGESFGEQAVLAGGVRSATAVAQTEVSALRITATGLRQMIDSQSPVALSLFEGLLLQLNLHNVLRSV